MSLIEDISIYHRATIRMEQDIIIKLKWIRIEQRRYGQGRLTPSPSISANLTFLPGPKPVAMDPIGFHLQPSGVSEAGPAFKYAFNCPVLGSVTK
jgi:hypothetical protein